MGVSELWGLLSGAADWVPEELPDFRGCGPPRHLHRRHGRWRSGVVGGRRDVVARLTSGVPGIRNAPRSRPVSTGPRTARYIFVEIGTCCPMQGCRGIDNLVKGPG